MAVELHSTHGRALRIDNVIDFQLRFDLRLASIRSTKGTYVQNLDRLLLALHETHESDPKVTFPAEIFIVRPDGQKQSISEPNVGSYDWADDLGFLIVNARRRIYYIHLDCVTGFQGFQPAPQQPQRA